ncbi:hypothetical protein EU642_22075 [Salmonella enterica]|nr:hypothetical protein [Salmonella enterica]EAO0118542.1 hypothetical protein [Salmonella enterica]EAO3601647.1 hypothetical protein [Salmonella enterica]EAR6391540.1 hypothetical protein [Salmonella enterica]EAV1285304.1 hypothetical protein [Salmonella enterica]
MALRKGIVVDVHPDDHSVDLVLVDNYARLTGVQVQAHTASSRSGSVDLPDVEVRKDKWNIAEKTGQEVQALVDFVGSVPVVTGFLYPQISQMTHGDGKLKYNRHTSDVQTYTDGEGNMGLLHPSGAHITIGSKPDPKDFSGANVDKNLKVDRNTGTKVYLRVALAGNVAVLTMTPKGECTLKLESTLDIECTKATVKASDSIVLDTPQTHITGKLTVDGTSELKGAVNTGSTIDAKGEITADGTGVKGHHHKGDSGGQTGTALP